MKTTGMENTLIHDRHVLVCIDSQTKNLNPIYQKEVDYIKANFCGRVYTEFPSTYPENSLIYLCGDIAENYPKVSGHLVYVVKELSYNLDNPDYRCVSLGEVPINLHNVGVYFRRLFDNPDYFKLITQAHEFQSLTESNKPGCAFRKGLYLTEVKQSGDQIHFNLLRCSTNLTGPTDNFRDVDSEIVGRINTVSQPFFTPPVKLNHVLAQIYENNTYDTGTKKVEKKAIIKAHSDKTKDMPRHALIAFTTFYDNSISRYDRPLNDASRPDLFDVCYRDTSVLTRLHFRRKSEVTTPELIREFSVTLYPGSVFIIPLSTNRLYTHEIKPSILPVDKIPTRMGYVVRCSNTKAIFKDGATYIDRDGVLTPLRPITEEDRESLRNLYFTENTTIKMVDYNNINFSMNTGDYKRPIV